MIDATPYMEICETLSATIAAKDKYIAALEARIDSLNQLAKYNHWLRILEKTTGATLLDRQTSDITMIFYGEKPNEPANIETEAALQTSPTAEAPAAKSPT